MRLLDKVRTTLVKLVFDKYPRVFFVNGRRRLSMVSKKKQDAAEAQETEVEQSDAEETQAAVKESKVAKIDMITGEKKMTMWAPEDKFEEMKKSFAEFMAAFTAFMEASGMVVGKDVNIDKISALAADIEKVKKAVKVEEAKRREEAVTRSEFDVFKAQVAEAETKSSEVYITRNEFNRFKEILKDVL